MSDTQQLQLNVTIKQPQRVEFVGPANAVTSTNAKGKFDVLPYHENFISIIKESVTIHVEGNKAATFPLKTGILKVNNNSVHILIGIEI